MYSSGCYLLQDILLDSRLRNIEPLTNIKMYEYLYILDKEDNMMYSAEDKALYRRIYQDELADIPEGLTLRRATADDYDDIIKFSKAVPNGTDILSVGRDYLPFLYHERLAHPSKYLFVAEKNKQAVSSNIIIIIIFILKGHA